MFKSLDRYPRYFLIGTTIAAITIGLREVLGRWWGDQSTVAYILSMVVAYGIGIILSYILQRRFTFKSVKQQGLWLERVKYLSTSLLGMGLTVLLAIVVQSGLNLIPLLTDFHKTLSFTSAALLTSFVTYFVNKQFTFTQ